MLLGHVHNATPIITFRYTHESAFLSHDYDLGSGFEYYVPIPIHLVAGFLGQHLLVRSNGLVLLLITILSLSTPRLADRALNGGGELVEVCDWQKGLVLI